MKVKVVGKIFETKDFNVFKFRPDNRPINLLNVKEKMESISQVGQMNPVTIDAGFHVIDGQHRLIACKNLDIAVKYVFDDRPRSSADIAHIQSQYKKWSPSDEVASFSQSNDNYKVYEEFKKEYPEFGHTILLTVLSNKINRDTNIEKDWHEGRFTVIDKNKAKKTLENLRALGRFYTGYSKRSFILSILKIQTIKDFDMSRLLRKMPKRCKEIMDFSRMEDYIDVLESIYNWKETKKLKFD